MEAERKIKLQERIGVFLLVCILIMVGLIMTKTDKAESKFVSNSQNQFNNSTTTTKKINNSNTKISINKASVEDLDTLPGIGAVIAGRIVEYRTQNGGFKSLDELKEVSGIGDAKYEKVKDLISL